MISRLTLTLSLLLMAYLYKSPKYDRKRSITVIFEEPPAEGDIVTVNYTFDGYFTDFSVTLDKTASQKRS